jgi:hypothetical protein
MQNAFRSRLLNYEPWGAPIHHQPLRIMPTENDTAAAVSHSPFDQQQATSNQGREIPR